MRPSVPTGMLLRGLVLPSLAQPSSDVKDGAAAVVGEDPGIAVQFRRRFRL